MTLHPQARARAAWAATSDAVATQLAQAARQSGGSLLATAADLHKLGTGEAWPRSALELHNVTLPELARRPAAAGCTVQRLADGRWHVVAAAVPVALPVALPAATAQPAAAVKPVAVPVAAGCAVAAAPTPTPPTPVTALTDAEFERVAAEAQAVSNRRQGARQAAALELRRQEQHRRNLELIAIKELS